MLKIRLALLVSTAVYAIVANSQSWKNRAPLISKYATDGQPVSLTCRKPPPGNVGWYRLKGGYVSHLNVDPRIQISAKGTLYFSYVNIMDTAVYKCSVTNSSTIQLGSPVQLNVTKGNAADTWPVLMYSSETTDATQGQAATQQCIFSGRCS
ncbi:leucine-rich repeat-containing protein 4-like [Haliotis rubra]|uniref:leucine-rich repeat-containing protein 4-like n=1 Tax=Haliotis rubra TaxID=36100 RepID=UPI001EE4EC7A|nr:leucine-rich repeat-containing protein 4-like [Haliotis rubra]